MASVNNLSCCGVKELTIGDSTPEKTIETAQRSLARSTPAFFVFTSADWDSLEKGGVSYGEKLTKLIRDNKLGSVKRTPLKKNPNSGNTLGLYVWNVDLEALRGYESPNVKSIKESGIKVGAIVKIKEGEAREVTSNCLFPDMAVVVEAPCHSSPDFILLYRPGVGTWSYCVSDIKHLEIVKEK